MARVAVNDMQVLEANMRLALVGKENVGVNMDWVVPT